MRGFGHSGRAYRQRDIRRQGMTLIEMMIVIVIVAVAATGVSYSLGAITRANLRSASVRLSAAARYAYGRAIAQNSTVRLRFDFATGRMVFEEAHGRIVLARLDDATRQELDDDEDGAAVDPWAAAQARLSDTLRPSFGASPFSAIEGSRFEAQELASGIRIARVTVPHEPEPVEDGEASIHFFPGGQTEHAVIWLADSEDRIYSVEIHPLTGRGEVRAFAYEPEEFLDDGEGHGRSEVDR